MCIFKHEAINKECFRLGDDWTITNNPYVKRPAINNSQHNNLMGKAHQEGKDSMSNLPYIAKKHSQLEDVLPFTPFNCCRVEAVYSPSLRPVFALLALNNLIGKGLKGFEGECFDVAVAS